MLSVIHHQQHSSEAALQGRCVINTDPQIQSMATSPTTTQTKLPEQDSITHLETAPGREQLP